MTAQGQLAGRRFLGLGPAGTAFLVVGVLAIVAFGLVGRSTLGDVIFVATCAAATVAVLFGVRRNRPLVPRAWIAVGMALACLTVADLLTTLARDASLAILGELAQVLFVAAYAPFFVAAFRFGRHTRQSDRTALLDAGIFGLAILPATWAILIEPNLAATSSGVAAVSALAIPVIDIVLVSVVAPLVMMRYSRSPSAFLLVGGLVALALGDAAFSVGTLQGTLVGSPLINVAWLASYVLLGASALVPSASQLGAIRDPRTGSGDRGRMLVLSIALLAPPLVTIRETWNDPEGELLLLGVVALALAMLLVLRLRRTIGQMAEAELRFRRFMSLPGVLAVIKDAAGRYLYLNPGAIAAGGLDGVEWYGRSDLELAAATADDGLRGGKTTSFTNSLEASGTLEHDGRVWHAERLALPGNEGGVAALAVDITDRVRAENEVRFQARLLENVRDLVMVVGTDRRVTYWNAGAEEILGYSAKQMMGRSMRKVIAPGSEAEVEALWASIERDETHSVDWHGRRRGGASVWLDLRVSPIRGANGELTGFLGVGKDVTSRKEAEVELARLEAAISHATDGVVVTDSDDRIVYVNAAFERLSGLLGADIRGQAVGDLTNGRAFARALAQARRNGNGWRGDIFERRSDGTDLVAQTSISPIEIDDQSSPGFVTIQRDVTTERAAERAADRRARERSLIAETLAGLRAGQTPEATAESVCRQVIKLPELVLATVVAFDVGGIGTVLGQWLAEGRGKPGLDLTRTRSDYLRTRAAAGPWVERWKAQPDHAYNELFERLDIVAQAYAPIIVDGGPIGILIAGSDHLDAIDSLAEQLPALLEFAAISGTLLAGQVEERNAAANQAAELRGILERGAFEIHFQPIVDLADGSIRGYEALTRFADGTRPDVRFEHAHALGIGLEFEEACLRQSFATATHLPATGWLNVNVSPELVMSGIVESLLPRGRREIILEITEHQAITDYQSFRDAIAPIRDRVKLAVDDAGAGFASLRHIVELAPSLVKIDRSLIMGIADDTARQAVVAGMVQFAEAAGLGLIAEGIEYEAELAVLRKLGVAFGQGYLLGSPARVANPRVPAPKPRAKAVGPRISLRRAAATTRQPRVSRSVRPR